MPGIDYSKWDKFSDGEESDCSEDGVRGKPTVTRLQCPSCVTVGPNGVHMEPSLPSKASASPFVIPNGVTATQGTNVASSSDAVLPPLSPLPTSSSSTSAVHYHHNSEEEDAMMYDSLTRNGGREGDSHLWSQTRDTASVSFILPTMQTRAKDICNFRLCSEEQPDGSFSSVILFGVRGIEGERRNILRYPVKVDNEVVEGCWQLHSLPTMSLRLMVVQLVKEPLAVGLTLWWEVCFVTDLTKVDTAKISDRSDAAAVQAGKFQKVWEQAHEEFKNQMSRRRDRQLNIDEDDNGDSTAD